MDAFWSAFRSSPPVTRIYAASIFVLSISSVIGLIDIRHFYYDRRYLFKFAPEIWRLATCFCFATKMDIIILPLAVWRYGAPLERDCARFTTAAVFTYMLFTGTCIIALGGEYLGAPFLTGAMIVALAYTYAQEHRGRQIQFFMFPVEVKYLPYLMLFLTLILRSPGAMIVDATGLVAAHLYDVLTVHWPRYGGGRDLLPTPALFERLFENVRGAKQPIDVRGREASSRPAIGSTTSSATASGVTNPLSFRGTGRRLGGT